MQRLISLLFSVFALVLACGAKPLYYTGYALTDSDEPLWLKLDKSCLNFTVATNATYRRGDRLHITGHVVTMGNGDTREIIADYISITSHTNLPTAKPVQGYEFDAPDLLHELVRLHGHLATAFVDELDDRTCWAIVKTESRDIPVAFSATTHPLEKLRDLIGAEVEAEGFVFLSSGYRQDLQRILMPRNADRVLKVLAPPPADPFDAPALKSASITCRQRVDGTVIAVSKDMFYVRTPERGYLPVKPADGARPKAGDTVTVVGFAEKEAFNLRLIEALFRPCRQPPTDLRPCANAAAVVTNSFFRTFRGYSRDAFRSYQEFIPRAGDIVCGSGLVATTFRENESAIRRFKLQTPDATVDIDLSGLDDVPAFDIGATAEITGMAIAEYENATLGATLPRFKKLTILPRTASDVRILKAAPWWTPARLQVAIAALLVVLFGAAVWIRLLHALSEKRGRELLNENAEKLSETLRVAERTRLAVELHDSISQNLTGVAMELEAAERCATTIDPKLAVHLDSATGALRSCRAELKNCIWDLRSNALEEPTVDAAIRKTLVPHLTGIELAVRFAVPRAMLTDNTCHAILSVIRELVVNGIRHGHATAIKVAGAIENGTLLFSVSDNGTGFIPTDAPGIDEGHFGLEGVSERISALGGTLELDSALGKGCKATISIRLPQNTNDDKSLAD